MSKFDYDEACPGMFLAGKNRLVKIEDSSSVEVATHDYLYSVAALITAKGGLFGFLLLWRGNFVWGWSGGLCLLCTGNMFRGENLSIWGPGRFFSVVQYANPPTHFPNEPYFAVTPWGQGDHMGSPLLVDVQCDPDIAF